MELMDIYDKDRNPTGRLHRRGEPMRDGDYQLVIHIFIRNSIGEYLITKRASDKTYPGLWEGTSGCVHAGETGKDAVLREVKEELGLKLDPMAGQLVHIVHHPEFNGIGEVWLFNAEPDICDVVLQENEAVAVKWADEGEIRRMLNEGEFVPAQDYIEAIFAVREKENFT